VFFGAVGFYTDMSHTHILSIPQQTILMGALSLPQYLLVLPNAFHAMNVDDSLLIVIYLLSACSMILVHNNTKQNVHITRLVQGGLLFAIICSFGQFLALNKTGTTQWMYFRNQFSVWSMIWGICAIATTQCIHNTFRTTPL